MQDLEIYIRDLRPQAVSCWLASHLDDLSLDDSQAPTAALKGRASYQGHPLRISLYPGAFGKRFTSLVLEGEALPWASDLDCARSAWASLQTEIRCSPGDWQEGEAVEEEKWWRLDERGEALAVWH